MEDEETEKIQGMVAPTPSFVPRKMQMGSAGDGSAAAKSGGDASGMVGGGQGTAAAAPPAKKAEAVYTPASDALLEVWWGGSWVWVGWGRVGTARWGMGRRCVWGDSGRPTPRYFQGPFRCTYILLQHGFTNWTLTVAKASAALHHVSLLSHPTTTPVRPPPPIIYWLGWRRLATTL